MGDCTIKIWDATTLQEVGTLEGHTSYVTSVAVFPDGSKIVSGSGDKTIKIWDATTLQLVSKLFDNADNNNLFCYLSEVGQIATFPDGASIAICSGNNVEVTSLT